jgi:hypothetical protein
MKLISSDKDYDHNDLGVLYRYEGEQDEHFSFITTYKIVLKEFQIIKVTPKGYWIRQNFYFKKWVSNDCTRRFAYPTKNEALFHFKKRKEKQLKILTSQVEMVQQLLNQIDKVNTDEKETQEHNR